MGTVAGHSWTPVRTCSVAACAVSRQNRLGQDKCVEKHIGGCVYVKWFHKVHFVHEHLKCIDMCTISVSMQMHYFPYDIYNFAIYG